jgi:acetylornithine deacetylase/succinyl-diaminopimelate desuccinylase-like protein
MIRRVTSTILLLIGISIPVLPNTRNENKTVCSNPQLSVSGDEISGYQKLAMEIFKELIGINTTSRFGSTAAAEAMAARLESNGFKKADINVIGPDSQHKNLVLRFKGNGKLKPLLFICHLDVVEALRDDWSFEPFTLTEKDGYFYGRGTSDIKNEDASLVANFIRLKKEGFVPDRDLILALTADEEMGTANGVNWLLNNHRDLIDAEFCINPDGGGGDLKNGKHTAIAVQTSEKIFVSFKLEVKNNGGHSSLPVKDNAIYALASGLSRLANFDFPVSLNETTRSYFNQISALESGEVQSDITAMLATYPDLKAVERLAGSSAYYNAMMRTTCVATTVTGGHAENALPQSAQAVINCRLVPEDNPENVKANIVKVLADTQISVTRISTPFLAPLSPLRDDVNSAVNAIATKMWPGVQVTPIMSTGATDGKYLRRAGIPVYGISGMFCDMDDIRAHGKDERIGVKDFYDGVEFMYRFIISLTSGK